MQKQQSETLNYFKQAAKEWSNKAEGLFKQKVNVIEQRNNYVVDIAKETNAKNILDVGCGSGDLVLSLAEAGKSAVGLDFSDEMIVEAKKKTNSKLSSLVHFECGSFFDYKNAKTKFDLVSANGFIEYISLEQLDEFILKSKDLLDKNGNLVFGSRNRLFNLFSLNAFTEVEIKNGTHTALLKESMLFNDENYIEKLEVMEDVPYPNTDQEYVKTGDGTIIDVTTRYQFTPSQLIKKLLKHGFKTKRISPVHVHGATISFKEQERDAHVLVADLFYKFTHTRPQLVPNASTFMIWAQKI